MMSVKKRKACINMGIVNKHDKQYIFITLTGVQWVCKNLSNSIIEITENYAPYVKV